MMINFIVLSAFYVGVIIIVHNWYRTKYSEEDYEKRKPPLYVYYKTGFEQFPFSLYLLISAGVSLISFVIMYRVFENMFVASIAGFVALFSMKQRILIKSIKKVQQIDNSLPQYLNAYFNHFQLNRNVLESFRYANQEADLPNKKELEVLCLKLVNNADPRKEIEKTKQKFRNPIIRDFLDSIHEELFEGFAHEAKVTRLIERSERRQQQATEQKVETFSGVLFIRFGIWFFMAVAILLFVLSPDVVLASFKHQLYGQIGLVVIILQTALMSVVTQRLILLNER